MSLPHSDACFLKAYPGETTEAFCDGHVAGFAFFGGVPRSILYDNTSASILVTVLTPIPSCFEIFRLPVPLALAASTAFSTLACTLGRPNVLP